MRLLRARICLLALCGALPAALPAADGDPWEALAELRRRLEAASPLTTEFEQTFVAAGFDTGDRDSGTISVDLPACLRWDYRGEFPNSFLLCGHLAHGWNEGESSGRRLFLAEGSEPGLDLLRLEVEELRRRYRARFVAADPGITAVELLAEPDRPGEVRRATLWFAAGEAGPRALAYLDLEGNRTRFDFGSYRPLADRSVFSPPAELQWLTD